MFRKRHIYTGLVALSFLVVFWLLFLCVGIFVPKGGALALGGLGKVFSAFPDISFSSGSIITDLDNFSLSVNFGAPIISLLSTSSTLHLNLFLLLLGVGLTMLSCYSTEFSFVTTAVYSIFAFILSLNIRGLLNSLASGGMEQWDIASGCFWLLWLIFAVILSNGVIGTIYNTVKYAIVDPFLRTVVTFFASTVFGVALSSIFAGLSYLTVGLGWNGGVIFWLIIAFLFALFCELIEFFDA